MERLIEFVNTNTDEGQLGSKFRFRMSTVEEYFTALRKTALKKNIEWQVHDGDFFPYNGIYGGHYWTGYFSSRQNFKRLIRSYTGLTQHVDTLVGLETLINKTIDQSALKGFSRERVNKIIQKVGELSHHDTITGTSPQMIIYQEHTVLESNITET